ncbi:unnamed protein product [Prorocentrum cordatum]|uniref:Calmodulin n=1 Tax=Prorocentrum cordatum TaxID=2364126 RepID=A0ABN9V351_9DINO|nr:unnamed protein product [Polarella glacialis]
MSSKAGTAYYVAPEVLKGSYDERCDVWSAGIITFILLCGYPPFSGETDPEILRKVKAGVFEFRSPEWDLISQGAKNLVTQMLTVDPSLRPSAKALLDTPWLRFKGTPTPAAIGTDFVRRLQGFRANSKLKKIALAIIAQQLPDEEIESLQGIFKGLDKNADGMLSPDEVRQGMLQHGLKVPQHLDDLLKAVDCNGSGQLDYTEFLATMIDKKVYMQRDVCWAAFRAFDLDGDGKITREELGKVLNGDSVKEALGASRIDKIIKEVDLDGDGVIDFEEFCSMMASRGRAVGGSTAGSAGAGGARASGPPAAKRAKKGAGS